MLFNFTTDADLHYALAIL